MKKILSIVVSAVLLFSLAVLPVCADDSQETFTPEYAARVLSSYGVMVGTEDGFCLDQPLTRPEAITMIVKLSGCSMSKTDSHPFRDVPAWADSYVACAYAQGLTSGVSATEFGTGSITASSFVTMVLRCLGYSQADGDFTWSSPWGLAGQIGLLNGVNLFEDETFTRGEAAVIAYNALSIPAKDSGTLLTDELECQTDLSRMIPAGLTSYSASDIYALGKNAVFKLELYNSEGVLQGTGSGFFISSMGVALTCEHCVSGFYSAKAIMPDGEEYDVTGLYGADAEADWAVIQVDGKGFNYFSLAEGEPTPGETVYTLGAPLGFDYSVSQGVIASDVRTDEETGFRWIQSTAQISSGSSGGVLLNAQGQAVGISEGSYTSGQNVNIYIPVGLTTGCSRDKLTTFAAYNGYSEDQISGYKDAVSVPDFGTCFGIQALGSEETEDGNTTYYYSKALANAKAGGSAFSAYVKTLTEKNFVTYYYASEDGGIYARFIRNDDETGYLVTINTAAEYKDTDCFSVTCESWDISPVKYYDGTDHVPDFGSYFGVETTTTGKTDGRVSYYEYLVGSFAYHANDKRYINIYASLLADEGFEMDSSYTVSASTFYLFSRDDGTRVDLEVYGYDVNGFFSVTVYNAE